MTRQEKRFKQLENGWKFSTFCDETKEMASKNTQTLLSKDFECVAEK
jgi:hypothetical protein